MCDRCQELKDEIAFLRRELGIVRAEDMENRLCLVLGISKTEAAILALLYNRRGATLSKGAIWDVLYAGSDSEPLLKIVDVFICKLRRRLPEDSIATIWGRGYTLTATGLAHVDEAIARPAEAITTAAPLVTKPPKLRGLLATIPMLRRLRQGPCSSYVLMGVVSTERRYQVPTMMNGLVRSGRAARLSGGGPGSRCLWGITEAGEQFLTDWDREYGAIAQGVAA